MVEKVVIPAKISVLNCLGFLTKDLSRCVNIEAMISEQKTTSYLYLGCVGKFNITITMLCRIMSFLIKRID